MTYTVEKISGKRAMKDFNMLPYMVYKNDPKWVPPLVDVVNSTLDRKANPYFNTTDLDLFVCYKGGIPVSRAITVINPLHWEKHGGKTAFFGFFESIEDKEGCESLFDHMLNHCIQKGAAIIEGPFNPNHYSEIGIQVPPYSTSPVFFETYNPPYYPELLENMAFKTSCKVHTRINRHVNEYLKKQFGAISKPGKSGDFTVREANFNHVESELEKIREVYNEAFDGNWHFLPLTSEEYNFSAKYLSFITFPNLVVFVEKDNEPVGVMQCMLNINPLIKPYTGKMRWFNYPGYMIKRNLVDEIVMYAVGVKRQYQGTEVIDLLVQALMYICSKYKVLSTTWMSDDNIKTIKLAEYFGLEPYKWFSIYKKSL